MALLGVVWFLITGLLSAVVEKDEKWLKYLLAWSAVGLLAVFVLVYVEIFLIGSICPLCTSAHVLEITILGLTVSLWVTRRA